MSSALQTIRQQIDHLSFDEKSELTEYILQSLASAESGMSEIDKMWIKDAQKRYQLYIAKKLKSTSAATILKKTYSQLQTS